MEISLLSDRYLVRRMTEEDILIGVSEANERED